APIEINCGESGSTLRFLIPLALALYPDRDLVFIGQGRLLERPLTPYLKLFEEQSISYQLNDQLHIRGKLQSGKYALSGKISSQFITGLLFALPLLHGVSTIEVTDELESKNYVEMTLQTLQTFGITVCRQGDSTFIVQGDQVYQQKNVEVEGDYSQGAFFYAANFVGSRIFPKGLNPDSIQGDRAIITILKDFCKEENIILDVSDIPDLVPALAVAAAFRDGKKTQFIHAERLRLKESDRITTTCQMLHAVGANIRESKDGMIIRGKAQLKGTRNRAFFCHNDHRIAMAAAIAAIGCKESIQLKGAECVEKSYPNFWEDYQKLGGNICEYEEMESRS
ncbi:MAG: 3-phosphoshikimate 1-carboxyvinyltransferase, partial [Oscillospiraceae bacterium]